MNVGAVLLIVGILVTALGVGGIDESVSDIDWWFSTGASVVGLIMMWAGVGIIKAQDE